MRLIAGTMSLQFVHMELRTGLGAIYRRGVEFREGGTATMECAATPQSEKLSVALVMPWLLSTRPGRGVRCATATS